MYRLIYKPGSVQDFKNPINFCCPEYKIQANTRCIGIITIPPPTFVISIYNTPATHVFDVFTINFTVLYFAIVFTNLTIY